MYAVEFHAAIENGVVHIPQEYQSLYNIKDAQVFIIPINKSIEEKLFNPKDFFNVAHTSKGEIDQYLQSNQNEWDV